MPKILNGQTIYSAGEALPTVGSPEYLAAQKAAMNVPSTPVVGSYQYDLANNLAPGTSSSGVTAGAAYSSAQDQQYDKLGMYYQGQAQQEVDPAAIFEAKRKQYQAEIDAVNKIYADKIKSARVQGQGRIGSSTAIQARSGLLGSDFGAAQTASVEQANTDIENAYLNEQSAQIQAILGKASSEAAQEARDKTAAKELGIKNYIEFLAGAETRKKQRVTNFAKSLIAQGKDIKTLSDSELQTLASTYGVTKDALLSEYQAAKNEQDKLDFAIKTEPEETAFTLSEGQQRYVLDPKTGQYTKVAGVPKTYAPKAISTGGTGGVSGVSGGGKYSNDLDAVIGTTLSTIPSKFGQATFNSQLSKARNDGDKINLVASQILKNQPSELKLDFANQSLGISNLDKAINEISSGTKTGFINDKLQYTFNVFGKDYDPKLAKIQQLITSAIQPYRNSVTGAAWGEQEEAEYQSLFGSTKYSPAELKQRLVNLKEILKSKSAQGLNSFVNPLGYYDNQFATGNLAPTQAGSVDTTLSEFGL